VTAVACASPSRWRGDGGLPSHDTRRWQSGPHLRVSLHYLRAILSYRASCPGTVAVPDLSGRIVVLGGDDLPTIRLSRSVELFDPRTRSQRTSPIPVGSGPEAPPLRGRQRVPRISPSARLSYSDPYDTKIYLTTPGRS
jgi:DNA-binding beta-propeller fold protein YncE